MKRLQIGDPVLITGPSHHEKAVVIGIDKKTKIITLDNQMQIREDYSNVTKTHMKAEVWDENKFEFLHARSLLGNNISTILRYKDKLPDEAVIVINNRLEKWLQKYNLKRI